MPKYVLSLKKKKMHYLVIFKITQDVHWGDKENYISNSLVIFFVAPVIILSNFE